MNSFLDAEGGVLRSFQRQATRHLVLDEVPEGERLALTQVEDMIMKGETSLACTCEPDSAFYNPARCDPDNYINTVDVNPDPFVEELLEYRVHISLNYPFNGRVCDSRRFEERYQPPFVEAEVLDIVKEGLRSAVIYGTATRADLPFINVAGKTGTAEYCDDIARPLGLCIPGSWPAHAWFTAYAPAEDPQILIIAFVYNGGEGSLVALPIVVETMEAWLRLQNRRGGVLAFPPAGA